ncbi:hypothetical protein PSACC_02524 [Paramicrosporidium saccamoebae]|uniref:Uncharacterized protein n=1 Tax=Paramicrosporidium saccamoebae TaxID=1246581 RepID=A0A2H9TIS8_9FUNG|nr:hypothetical protein PSACC_02524 [Paramicrosporidium saccamoebae]
MHACLLVLVVLIIAVNGELFMRSLLLFEAEELPDPMQLLPRQDSLELLGPGASLASLAIVPQSTNLTISCTDAFLAIVRNDYPSQICTPGGEIHLRNVTVTGIMEGDVLVASLIEDLAISARLLYDLAKLPDEMRASRGITPRKKRLLDATATGKILRTIVVRVESDTSMYQEQ